MRDDYRRFTLVALGGKYGVDAGYAGRVRIEKDHTDHDDPLRRTFEFRYPLLRAEADAPLPGFLAPPPDADWRVGSVIGLRAALRFLTPRRD